MASRAAVDQVGAMSTAPTDPRRSTRHRVLLPTLDMPHHDHDVFVRHHPAGAWIYAERSPAQALRFARAKARRARSRGMYTRIIQDAAIPWDEIAWSRRALRCEGWRFVLLLVAWSRRRLAQLAEVPYGSAAFSALLGYTSHERRAYCAARRRNLKRVEQKRRRKS